MTFLSLLVLRARDLEETLRFYRSLGLQFQQEQHGSGPVHFSAMIGEAILELYPLKANQTEADDTTMLGFQVPDIAALLSELGIKAEIKSSPWGRFCTLTDPDGRTVRFTETPDKALL